MRRCGSGSRPSRRRRDGSVRKDRRSEEQKSRRTKGGRGTIVSLGGGRPGDAERRRVARMTRPGVTIRQLTVGIAVVALNLALLTTFVENIDDGGLVLGNGLEGITTLVLVAEAGLGLAWLRPGRSRRFGYGVALGATASALLRAFFPEIAHELVYRCANSAFDALDSALRLLPDPVLGWLFQDEIAPFVNETVMDLAVSFPGVVLSLIAGFALLALGGWTRPKPLLSQQT